jgi:cell division protein FtsI (penicillin-binding protein 3)
MEQDDPKKIQKDTARAQEEKVRMLVVMGGLMLFGCLVLFRLGVVQIMESSEYQKKARRQYEYKVPVSAARGQILDRTGKPLATSLIVVSFAADPKIVADADTVAQVFATLFGRPKQSYLTRLKEKSRFVWLERRVPMSVAKEISELHLAGVIEMKEVNRHYENLASQLIGFTDSENKGISGVEKQYDSLLAGHNGYMMMQRTATGRAFPAVGSASEESIAGATIDLTIDLDIQSIAEDELGRGIINSGSDAGMAMVMDVRTGEVLAMANAPDFNMNAPSTRTSEAVRNRAVTDVFEPGSTFKLVMASAATELGIVTPETKVDGTLSGKWKIKDRTITDHEPVGTTTFKQALAKSSNIVAAKTGLLIGKEKFYEYAHAFGFGQKTGVGLNGELPGSLKRVESWSGISLPWMAHGYEVLVTPLQMLTAYSALANDGIRMKPYIIKEMRDENGKTILKNKPVQVQRVLKSETAKVVRDYFQCVVDSGTGMPAAIDGISVGGKTGTAQLLTNGSYKSGKYVASFVGFFPVEKPVFAAIVMMVNPRNGYYGGTAAAPTFGRLGGRMVAALGDDYRNEVIRFATRKEQKEKLFLDTVKTVVVPNVCGLDAGEAKQILRVHGLDFKIETENKGVVMAQGIEPEKRVAVWTKVPLKFSETSKTVPSFVGLRADRAIYAAEQLGLKVEAVGTGNRVASQSLRVGMTAKPDAAMVLTLH